MIVRERKGWKSLNVAFEKWYLSVHHPSWTKQRNWLSKEFVKREFVTEKQLPKMWDTFSSLAGNCNSWDIQSKMLSFITLCLDNRVNINELVK